jgi:hypothetical protein
LINDLAKRLRTLACCHAVIRAGATGRLHATGKTWVWKTQNQYKVIGHARNVPLFIKFTLVLEILALICDSSGP